MLFAPSILPLFQVVRDSFYTVFLWLNKFLNSIVRSDGSLYSLLIPFIIPIAIAVLIVSIKFIKNIVWGP